AQEREQRVAENRQRQRADAAEAIGDRAPQHREAPADQKEREQDAAVEADVAGGRRNPALRQQLGQRRREDERIDERIHPVERPAAPGGPEPANLIRRETGARRLLGQRHSPPRPRPRPAGAGAVASSDTDRPSTNTFVILVFSSKRLPSVTIKLATLPF